MEEQSMVLTESRIFIRWTCALMSIAILDFFHPTGSHIIRDSYFSVIRRTSACMRVAMLDLF